MSDREKDYVLGTHDAELQRLGLQHQLWRAQAYRAWERARFGPGDKLLDVGCGPGFATADLSSLAGEMGRVTAIDVSDKYIARVKSLNLRNVDTHLANVMELDGLHLPANSFTGAYARWVLCFVPDPQVVVNSVATLLSAGGRFVIQDYCNYASIMVAPKSEAFDRVIKAVNKSWRDHGGDPDVACRLPTMLERAGLRVTSIEPLFRLARPNDSLWRWPTSFYKIFIPTLVQTGYLTQDDQDAFDRDWAARSKDPAAYFTSPPMVDIVATKPA